MSDPQSTTQQQILHALQRARAQLEAAERREHDPIAIVGMSARFPGAPSVEAFWSLLCAGTDAIREVPPERWPLGDDVPEGARYGGFLTEVDQFDPLFFGISPREAISLDPQHRLLLELSWEALERAGYLPPRLAGHPTGIFVGISTDDYARMAQRIPPDLLPDTTTVTGVPLYAAAGRLSYTLGLTGPSLVVTTACSSSLVALHLACQSLRAGECELALAGGVNLMLDPDGSLALARAQMLAPDGRCKTFDASANGMVRGEGCGVVVLKRLADAQSAGDTILALIRGSAINQDGPSSGFTVPNGSAQQTVIRQALARANVPPAVISYVEAHGTGTALGDPIEVTALGAVLGAGRKEPLLLGSVKTNIGHLEAAAGIAGLIKTVLALQHSELPPHLHFHQPSAHIPWAELPIEVVTSRRPWPATPDGRRVAGVSSFGASGTNAHVILEAAPPPPPRPDEADRPCHLVTLSARSAPALARLAAQTEGQLAHQPLPLADVAFTTNVGRRHLPHRLALVAATSDDLRRALRAACDGEATPAIVQGRVGEGTPRVAFLFTGQGSQVSGMGRDLYEQEPVFRATLDRCAELLAPHLDRPLLELLWDAPAALDDTRVTQPALFALEYALAELWRSWGIVPDLVMGHSVGEYVAACVAGIFSLEDGLRLIAARARLMGVLPPGGAMVALFTDEAEVRAALSTRNGPLAIAALNGPAHTVLSGAASAVEQIAAPFRARGVRVERLSVSHAFHSPLMEPMLADFTAVARTVTYRAPHLPLISNLTGGEAEMGSADDWVRHVLAPVRFAAGMQALAERGVTCFVEIGPKPVLLGMGRHCLPDHPALWLPSLRDGQAWPHLIESVAALHVHGVPIEWPAFHQARVRRRVPLPTTPWERQRYWLPAVAPTRPGAPRDSHPLLGHRRPSPLAEVQFEALVSQHAPDFLSHHRLYDRALFPASGYYEMALAAGATRWPRTPLELRDVLIQQALFLPEQGHQPLHFLLRPAEESDRFEVWSPASEDRWTLHASGQIAPLTEAAPTPQPPQAPPTWEALALPDAAPDSPAIAAAWRQPDGRTVRARLHLPDALLITHDYHLHPLLLDSCIKVLALAFDPAPTAAPHVQVGVERFRFHASPATSEVWVEATPDETDSLLRTASVRLTDSVGHLLAELVGVQLKQADRQSLLGQPAWHDWLYRPAWQPEPRLGRGALPTPTALHAALDPAPARTLLERLPPYWEAVAELEAQSVVHVVRAFHALGWRWQPGEQVEPSQVAQTLGVLPQHARLVGRMMEMLASAGYLRQEDARPCHTVLRPLVPLPELTDGETTRYPLASVEFNLLGRCGPALAAVLRGDADPIELLFPGGDTRVATQLYENSPGSALMNGVAQAALRAIVAHLPAGRGLRVLEIGGGTGGTTSGLLPLLPPERTDYLFTDVGPLFVAKAQEKFAAYPFVRYQTLDIEQEPRAQGIEGSFDLIIAANVLHATRDLAETLAHSRGLLAPGGLLLLIEGSARLGWIDLTFGLTDGWWRFRDTALRPTYPLLTAAQWHDLLIAQDFAAPVNLAERLDHPRVLVESAVFLAQRPLHEQPAAEKAAPWLILADTGGTGVALAAQLQQAGMPSLLAWPEGTSLPNTPGHLHLSLEPAAFARALHNLPRLRGVVHLWGLGSPPPALLDAESLHAATTRACGSALLLAQQLPTLPAPPPLWLVTRGSQRVGGEMTPLAVAQTPLWGLGKSIALEHPELRCTLVELDSDAPDSDLPFLLDELTHPDSERQVACRAGTRHLARLQRLPAATLAGGERALSVREEATYLLTGGLGGIGLAVAGWLVAQGARHLVLVGRHAPQGAARETLLALEAMGARIVTLQADVSRGEEVAGVLAHCAAHLPPLRGILHAAGIFEDRLLRDHHWSLFEQVFAPKVAGGWHLHEQSRDLPLDFFALFSSGSSLMGAAGVSNYGAANSFLDGLAHYRQNLGLPAISLNWGAWRGLGMAAAVGSQREAQWETEGLIQMEPEQALAALAALLPTKQAQVGVLALNWERFLTPLRDEATVRFFSAFRPAARPSASAAARFRHQLDHAPERERWALLTSHVREQVIRLLALPPATDWEGSGFFDLGMDSLMSVEFRNRLQTSLSVTLPSTITFKYPKLAPLVDFLGRELLHLPDPTPHHVPPADPDADALRAALRSEVADLSEDELESFINQQLELFLRQDQP